MYRVLFHQLSPRGGGGKDDCAAAIGIVVLAILAILTIGLTLLLGNLGVQSSAKASDFNGKKTEAFSERMKPIADSEKQKLIKVENLYGEMREERVATGCSQIVMAIGTATLVVSLVAAIVALANKSSFALSTQIALLGGGTTAIGGIGWGLTQLHYECSRKHRIIALRSDLQGLPPAYTP